MTDSSEVGTMYAIGHLADNLRPINARYCSLPRYACLMSETRRLSFGIGLISLVYSLLFCWFIVVVLIRGKVETPFGVFWEASTTNWIVTILSLTSAYLTDATMRSYLSVLKTVLLTRSGGLAFASYVGLGEASGWFTVFQVSAMNWFLDPYCNFRLSLPILGLAFGSVLKFQATFRYYFIASSATMVIFAGLIPLDIRVMKVVTQADMAMFFEIMSSNLLSNSKYALDFPLDGCSGDCRSIIMPGGMEMARQVKQHLNESVFTGGTFDYSETVRFGTVPGFILRFDKADSNLTFDLPTDCVYGGEQVNNGIQICIKQHGPSTDVGWAACPKALLDKNMCNTNTTWRSAPMNSTTRMTAYKQFTTPSYNRRNGSIVDIQIPEGSKPLLITTNATDYKTVFRAILIPRVNATVSDISNINSLIHAMTWSHRTYVKTFPDNKDTTTSNLRNVLAVPFQHTVTATIFGNYSLSERGQNSSTLFTLPDEMITTATGGTSNNMLSILKWTGWVFIAGDLAIHLLVAIGMIWVLFRKADLPASVGMGDIEVSRAAARTEIIARRPRWRLPIWFMTTEPGLDDVAEETRMPLLEVVEREDVGGGTRNTWQLARMLRGVRVMRSGKVEDVERDAGAERDSAV